MDAKFLEEVISYTIMGRDINNAEYVLSQFGKVKICDEGYDDAVVSQDSEDKYVMYRSYDLTADNKEYHIKFYYGNQAREVTWYQIF